MLDLIFLEGGIMQLILVRGLPGSGKSTHARVIANEIFRCARIEADMYFTKNGEYVFDTKKLGDAHKWCLDTTSELLSDGISVVVSNTFTTKKELKPYFDIAKELGIKPHVILCQGNYKNIHNVPEETIKKMKNRFEYDISELFNE